ncbi:MAG: TIGR01212 family radical SAM protein [Peptostreptococcaceae bacterium]|nr:TIGR01212 family radical SAM protein [Peptostreptococcaceae bacterium]
MKNRYYSINEYLKKEFGQKTVKLSLDGGFTCPNRDGTKGYGGCAFCSANGSGEFASTIDKQIELLYGKWPNVKYLAYFQNHTNTYAPIEDLRKKYYEALNHPLIEGLVIGTRPDCIDNDVLDLLSEINENYFMWVELGLQTTNEKTSEFLNLKYTLNDFDTSIERLKSKNIKTVAHLILGLPNETEEDMFNSVKYVCDKGIFGIKLHMLNIVKESTLGNLMPDYTSFNSIDEYADLVIRILEIIPENITLHRLTADAPRSILMTPEWSYKKLTILNKINNELAKRDTCQGKKISGR